MPGAPGQAGKPGKKQVPVKQGGKQVSASARDSFMENGRTFGRAPTDFERHVFDLHGVPSTLDDAQARLVRAMGAIRREQLQTVAERIAKKDSRNTAAFTDIRHAHIKMPKVGEIVKAIRAAQTEAFEYGRQTVRDELGRQGLKMATQLADDPTGAASKQKATSTLVSSAQITARKQAENWLSRAMDEGLRQRRAGVTGDALRQRIIDKLLEEADTGAKRDAAAELHEAFGLGRALQAKEMSDSIEKATYSAILDAHTCEVCQGLDGEEFAMDSDGYYENEPPNPNCAGGDACRCVFLYTSVGEQAE